MANVSELFPEGFLEENSASPQLLYPMSSTPLILPRDWTHEYQLSPSTNNLFDFQSNHLEGNNFNLPFAGLGIRNLELESYLESKNMDGAVSQSCQSLTERCHDVRNSKADVGFHAGLHYEDTTMAMEGTSSDNPWPYLNFTNGSHSPVDDNAAFNVFPVEQDFQISIPTCPSGGDIQWSLESLSASAGLSIADFAAQISATAEMALKHMEAGEDLRSLKHLPVHETPTQDNLRPLWPSEDSIMHWSEPSNIPTTVLGSMNGDRNHEASWNYGWTGVNPADILPNFNISPSVSYGSGGSEIRAFSRSMTSSMSTESISGADFEFRSTSANIIARPVPTYVPFPRTVNPVVPDIHEARTHGSDDEHSLYKTSSSSEYSPPPEFSMVKRDITRVKRRQVARTRTAGKDEPGNIIPEDPIDDAHLLPLNLGTPVLDAHRGISIEELKAKAERYRLRNQGRDYDKRWLISFAGKLSARGELITEFRCYVSGCKQMNKRRDHILIHVGAHLDQRPFKCMHCTSRFLRKNECKRHELSHSGVRPFSCNLCPYPATTFVRQDLLKRHMKRTHHVDVKNDKENSSNGNSKPRGRKKTRF